MKIQSAYPPKTHISAMKERMGGHMELGCERFTGFFLGCWFTVTHHSGYEWNRRISNVKNTAIGYVRSDGQGSYVHYIHLRGLLAPTQILFYFLAVGFPMGLIGLVGAGLEGAVIILVCYLAAVLIAAPISALVECLVDASEDGRRQVQALLLDPVDPFSYLNNKHKL